MDLNNQTIINKRPIKIISSSVPMMKRVKYNPATKFIGLTIPAPALPAKLFSSPVKNPKILTLRTPKQPVLNKSPVHVNLMERFNHLSNTTKENIVQQTDEKPIRLSSELVIKSPNTEIKTETTDRLKELARRGITITAISPAGAKWLKCPRCSAYFISKNDLINHELEFHQPKAHDYGLPVVDLSKAETREKLIALGISNYMTITNMNQSDGCASFGIPIVSVQGSANSTLCNILAMGADGILSLGSFKEIRK